jgi:predicted GIY-YIG superfamily endonuclease
MQGCYLLHFEPSYKHAGHYLGWSPEVQARVNAHLHGKGARLTEVAHNAGITLILVCVWEEASRKTERKLKNRHSRRLCPICLGNPVQLPLLRWMAAYVPSCETEEEAGADGLSLDEPQHTGNLFDNIDYEAELEDYREYLLDIEFWRSGQ